MSASGMHLYLPSPVSHLPVAPAIFASAVIQIGKQWLGSLLAAVLACSFACCALGSSLVLIAPSYRLALFRAAP